MKTTIACLTAAFILTAAVPALAGPAQDGILKHFQQQAGGAASPDRGKSLFETSHAGGKPETPACTSCHGKTPSSAGKTRAGKKIEPLALSKTPDRYGDLKKVEKWFRRNCNNVLGRECTAQEKTDFLAFVMSQ